MLQDLNDVVCIDHFHLDDFVLFHAVDNYSRFSAALPVSSKFLDLAISAFESTWISQFCPPSALQDDVAFRHAAFIDYREQYDILFRPIPPAGHHKHVLQSKQGVI